MISLSQYSGGIEGQQLKTEVYISALSTNEGREARTYPLVVNGYDSNGTVIRSILVNVIQSSLIGKFNKIPQTVLMDNPDEEISTVIFGESNSDYWRVSQEDSTGIDIFQGNTPDIYYSLKDYGNNIYDWYDAYSLTGDIPEEETVYKAPSGEIMTPDLGKHNKYYFAVPVPQLPLNTSGEVREFHIVMFYGDSYEEAIWVQIVQE